MDRRKPVGAVPVESYTHQDMRTNIPTEELRGFAAGDDGSRETVLYPRDPDLDPQLVWKGKDEQDRHDLQVPIVPIYIQEKIRPQAIIEQVRAHARERASGTTPRLFGDFDDFSFDERLDFYHSQQHWSNRMILGDSMMVMSSLAEKEGLKGKVQMIYMDPPYGIKFGSNWQVSTRKRDVKDGKADDLTRQPEQIKAFRDTWQLGIHSYLTYLRDRLTVARDLLTESGSIFVQIGDENVHLVRSILDEVFGSENFCAQITFSKTTGQTSSLVASSIDYLLWYGKNREVTKYRQLYLTKSLETDRASVYNWVEFPDGTRRRLTSQEKLEGSSLSNRARIFRLSDVRSQSGGETTNKPVEFQGRSYSPGTGYWKTAPEGMKNLTRAERLTQSGSSLAYVRYVDDFPAYPVVNLWTDTGTGSFTDDKVYVVQTGTKVIQRCILMTSDPGDLVLDPTCGSGTTAYVAEQWGRRWITIDTSRVALALARTRLMAARYPYYLLSDSQEGAEKERDITGQIAPTYAYANDLRKGFVYKRVPHVTLKSIANNSEIDTIYGKWHAQMEPMRARLNAAVVQAWEEWQVPREAGPGWPEAAKQAHAEWWRMRRERQKEIDASIAQRADMEVLYDQPYEDPKRVRVTGPFTVESLSPHRVLAPVVERPKAEVEAQRDDGEGQFEAIIVENLKKAGVQNTVRGERLTFDTLELAPQGQWIQARGEYTDKSGETKRVAVAIGPQFGTVGSEQVQRAALEAMKGLGSDLLLVCGFAFDAVAEEKAREIAPLAPVDGQSFATTTRSVQYGTLQILLVRMNPDLTMGDELLKKTGTGNLFMVFGEPDIHIARRDDGKLTVHLRGVDIYDPTTGEIRSGSTDDIACWFLDTNYDEQSFFVRHAYFTGTPDAYDKLKRALRADINEVAWQALYTAESLPFDRPATGKIAVKVINHYGDEVLKAYTIH